MNKVFAYQRAKARAAGIAEPRTLGISVNQRFGSLLQLNPRLHNIVPDGVLFDGADGRLTLWTLPAPTDRDVQAVALRVVKAVLAACAAMFDELADVDPDDEQRAVDALLWEAARSPLGRAATTSPSGSRFRTAQVQTDWGMFSIHANTAVAADNRAGLERLIKYTLRPPLCAERLSLLPSGKVCYRLRKPYYTGQTELILEPVPLLRRLAAQVPPARQNQVRYFGLLASQAADHERLRELAPEPQPLEPKRGPRGASTEPRSASRTAHRIPWADLLRRTFAHDVLVCPRCGSRRTVLAVVTEPDPIERILGHLGLPTEVPMMAPARAPPLPFEA